MNIMNELFAAIPRLIISHQAHVRDHPLQVLIWFLISRTLTIPREDCLNNYTLDLLTAVGVVFLNVLRALQADEGSKFSL